jgi:biopolymer transport protein TolR
MGVSINTGGGGGKKPLNADLNLVPYIDLLTCMVAFLLITAVWTQLARLSVNQKGQGQAGDEVPPEPKANIAVMVNPDGFNLVVGQDQTPIPKKGDTHDFERLSVELKKVKDAMPDRTDIKVASDDTVKFETLVRTMDAAITTRFPDVSLMDSGAAGL